MEKPKIDIVEHNRRTKRGSLDKFLMSYPNQEKNVLRYNTSVITSTELKSIRE